MENEFEPIRGMMGKGPERTAPAGFTDKVMQQVEAMEQRRIYRRLVLVTVLRSVVFVGVLLALLLPLILHGFRVEIDPKKITDLAQEGRQLLDRVYFLFPFVLLLCVRRLFTAKK